MADLERGLRELITNIVRDEIRRALAETKAPVEYLSTSDAASLAKVTTRTVRRWIDAGKLRQYRAGRELRVQRADVERLMSQSWQGGREPSDDDVADAFVRKRFG